MQSSKLNISEIAKLLGVSKSTVSKALNNSHEISDSTKLRIQKFAAKNNYKPNKLAVNLKSGTTKTIGVIIPSIQNNFFAKVLKGIEFVATEADYNIITTISNESYKKEVKSIELLSSGVVDGFILAIAEETQINQNFNHFIETIQQNKPIVMFDRVTKDLICDQVIVDDFKAAYQATLHFVNLKCKTIALVSTIDYLSVGKLRKDGYKKALTEAFGKVDNDLIIVANANNIDVKIMHLLKHKKIDAILALDEDAVLATYKASKFNNYNLDHHMAIIGYASEKIAENLTPSLTTLNQHGERIGRNSAHLLLDKLKNKANISFQKNLIVTTLVERESTKAYTFK